MGISEALGNAYMKVEDAYYGVLDFFEEKGIGLPWTYNDFLETKGVPALPFTIALLAILVGGMVYISTSNAPQDVAFTLNLKDDKGRALEDVLVKITDFKGKVLDELTASDGQTITLKGVSPNEKLTISARKQGFGEKTSTLFAGDNSTRITLQGSNDAIVGKLKLIDGETGTTITGALIQAEWSGSNGGITTKPSADGIALLNVPLDEEISLVVRADNYEDLVDTITFSSDDVKIKELSPKASANTGKSVLVVKAIDKKTLLPLEDVHIRIENAQTGETISDVDVSSGTHSENLTKGLVVRVSVSKDGYTMYTSNTEYAGGKTLRNEEEVLLAPLSFGGTSLHVITQSESSKQPLSGVELTLMDGADEKLDSQTSNFSGESEFAGLNETNAYTLLAFSSNFFPKRVNVDWTSLTASESGKTMLVTLTPFVSGSAGTLTVFVSELDGKAATQASVSIFEKVNGEWLPLLAPRSPDAVGSFTARIPVGMTILVRAERESAVDEEEVTIVSGLNKVVLTLEEKKGVVSFTLQTSDGKPFEGSVTLTTSGGNELFSGNVNDGKFKAVIPAGEMITLTTLTTSGKKFTKTFSVGNEKEMTIILDDATNTGNAPTVLFEGLFDALGNAVPGISATQDVFARFSVKWPTARASAKGGIFVRVGEDTIASVDAQHEGIIGLNADVDKVTYGRSWNPLPTPGKETKDRSTSGRAGTFNKWMEALVNAPIGTQTFDVRLRAREGVQDESVNVHYRAFTQDNTQITRTPADAQLGGASFTATKSGLYAQSLTVRVPVYQDLPYCQGKICVTLNIVDGDNRTYERGSVQTLVGKMYALSMNVQTNAGVNAAKSETTTSSGEGLVPLPNTGTSASGSGTIVKATTDNENPLLVFTKVETGNFSPLKDTGVKDTSVSFTLSGTSSASGAGARIHFLPESEGDTTVTLNVIAGGESFTQTIPVEIVKPNALSVEHPETIESGAPLTIRVLDSMQQVPVTNALITLSDASGKFSGSVKGTNTSGKGENGTYTFSKALSTGLYTVRVTSPGYADAESGLSVGINNPITLDEKVVIAIPFGQTSATKNVTITNQTAYPLTEITGEIKKLGAFPNELTVSVGTISAIPASGKATIPITATYSGDPASTKTINGSATLHVHGSAALAFPVNAETTLSVSYNPALDASCLQFSKEKLSITLQSENQPYGNAYTGNTFNEGASYYGSANAPQYQTYNAQGVNAYGFDTYGNYSNAETKRVNVKVKNNCGETLNLVPGITQDDGQPVVDGLRIAAIDSSLQLANGQEKQVDFEISNSMFRAGVYSQPVQFFATFSAPQIMASLPINVQFWDRSTAIQTLENVELTLIKTGNQKAVDRATIPITNIGASPIYGLTATLSGENTSDVTIKLENAPGKVNGNTNVLLPGQTLYPALSVLAESVRDDSALVSKQLMISGMIEGRKVNLREINIFVRTGSSSCLDVSAFDTPVSFISSETQGSISKRITIQNKCLEPVRVTRLETPKLGTNALEISSAEGDMIVEMNSEKEFNLTLTKGQAFKNQFSIQVVGLMQLSQKTITSNTLPVVVALGENELEFSQASNPVQVDVCEGGKITIRYPVLAKKDECSQAYCDAEQASHMIAEAIEKQLSKAVQQMQAQKNNATAFAGCDVAKRYCTFSQLGITSPSFTIYLQNDILTTNMLSYVMKSGAYPRLAGMLVSADNALVGENADDAFASHLGTGFGNAVYLPEINGCGKYDVTIVGGVEVVTNQLQSDKLSAGIKLAKTKENTAECQDKIYNAANFLPKNKSVSIENSQQTRLGVVEYASNALQTPAEWLAETVFGKSTRATKNSNSNRMTLNVGNLSQSIVELTLDPLTKGVGAKNIITVVRQTQGEVQKEAMVEAGKIITNLGKSVKGCITRDEQTWRIISVPDVGQFTYEGCPLANASDGGLVVRSTLTCCTLSTRSDVMSDVAYTLTPSGSEPMPGLTQLDLYAVGVPVSAENTYAKPGEKISYESAYAMVFDSKKQVYGKDILLCGTTDPRIQQQANKQTIQTIATRALDETRAGPLKLEIRTCTMDADDALARAYKKGNGTWYATLDWDSDDARKTILQTIAEATQTEKLGNAYVSYQGQGILANDNPVYQEKLGEKKLAALGSFALNCALACGACQGVATIATLGATLPAMAWDCVTACGTGTIGGAYELYKDNADGVPVLDDTVDVVEATYGNVRDVATSVVPGNEENEVGAGAMFAGTTAAAVRAGVKPLAGTEKGILSGVNKLNYTNPVSTVKADDLKFISANIDSVNKKIATNRGAISKWLSKFVGESTQAMKDPVTKAITTVKVAVPVTPVPEDGKIILGEIVDFTSERDALKNGFDKLLDTYKSSPDFAKIAPEVIQARDAILKNVDALNTNVGQATNLINNQLPVSLETKYSTALGESVKKSSEGILKKIEGVKTPQKWYQTKGVKTSAKFARSLVCGGVGNIAGYSSYSDELSQEVENKITLEAGSDSILDAQTNELVFEKGQTYQFIVTPGSGQGTSQTIRVDVVAPTTQVNPTAWLDDCSAT